MTMKDLRFNINLYVIIPVIFAGLTILSLLSAYRLTRFYLDRHLPPEWPLLAWGAVLTTLTFACGLLVVKFLIAPVRRFVDRTQTMGVLRDIGMENDPPHATGDPELHRFERVFDQVTEILSKVEARTLFPEIVGQSTAIRAVLNQILKVAPTDAIVLIAGETGTGKELVAHSIHRHSRHQSHPFVAMNCAAIPEGLLESELFGHEKGAFTGAVNRKPGKMELAGAGTLFLDEIGDMPLETQAKMLRALEEKRIVRVGGIHPITVAARFIAATNKNLPEMVQQELFRQDLFYRLNVFVIQLPPLRERREDIPLLAEHLLDQVAPEKHFAPATMHLLTAHAWPGNVRELQNAIQSAAVLAGATIEPNHLPSAILQNITTPLQTPAPPLPNGAAALDERLRTIEKQMIVNALSQTRGVQKQAAEILGIKERSLWHRLKKYEIDAGVFKR
ncbi:sigma-54 interaction domain-containing protein [Desulfatitalea alkaliphila]|uniref:Sigma-54 dependent transcriptional regulator n=1 Tax=Desulfatitalea alkaliphila TaxID=2929485 RepID=A0AA41R5S6_9BACT|nr:sigma-54 dependent transcriptional regulator [Desulfatitalea alkaliphila]MCJ8501978.1 sigma-54 dependent transcriptional regulator [Desulfatitalea alkaliphila]